MKWYRIQALLLKYTYISMNRIDRLFDIIYWPIIDLFVWGFASYYIKALSNINILSMLLGGIILWVFVWRSSQDIATFVLEDFWARNLYNLFSSPIKISEHVTSIILFAFLRGMTSFAVLVALSYLMYSFNIFTLPLFFLGFSVLILSMVGWSLGLLIVSLLLRFGQRIQVLAWSSIWVIQPFSCVFYPLAVLPPWAQSIAKFLPTTYVFENMRNFFLDGATIVYSQLVYAFTVSLFLMIISGVVLYYSFKNAKKTGLLARGD